MDHEPMAIFYCLYFCVYYNNKDIVEFLRSLIFKLNLPDSKDKIKSLLENIDNFGLERIRTVGENVNK
jgi:hypothetical protein